MSRPNRAQFGNYEVEAEPYTDLASGTAITITPPLVEDQTYSLYSAGVNAYTSTVEQANGKEATRIFVTNNNLDQANVPRRHDGSLSPEGLINIMKLMTLGEKK